MKKRWLALALILLPPAIGFAANCPNLTRNLSRGTSGDDVKQLQLFLIGQNDLATSSDTGYFGGLTEAAVQKFQCGQKVICEGSATSTGWGSVGSRTRAAIVAVCGGTSQSPPPPPNGTPSGGNLSCEFGGKTIANRNSAIAYSSQSVPQGSFCESELRTCSNGKLSGSYPSSFCYIELGKTCTLDGITILDGQYQTYYSTRSTQSPDSCSGNARLRLCSNGVLSDSAVYQYASCSVTGQSIASTSPQFPSGLRATCDASGARVTLTWNATPLAVNYAVRVIPTGSPLLWVRRDGLASTTFYASTTPGINYSWWIFANPSPPSLGQYTLGDPYVCVATSSASR